MAVLMSSMIEAIQLQKTYGQKRVVQNLSFRVEEGQTLALVGTSGCGKTTTLKMLNRLIEPTAGKVKIDQKDVSTIRPEKLRRQMGYVIQNVGLFPHYTIADNVGLVPRLLNWDPSRIYQRSIELLNRLKLPASQFAHRYPHQLSGGQQQRVGIARALAAKPPILLMDEPFGALDPITRQHMRQDFLELEELRQTTTIIVTHDIEEAFELADLVCVLDKGLVQQLGTPKQLLLRPANTFVKAFIGKQFTELAQKAISLSDIAGHLQEFKVLSYAIEFQPDDTIAKVVDRLFQLPPGQASGKFTINEKTYFIDPATLINTFHHFLTANSE